MHAAPDVPDPAEWIERAASVDGDRPALVFGDRVVTYGELGSLVDRADVAGPVHVVPVGRLDLETVVTLWAGWARRVPVVPVRDGAGAVPADADAGDRVSIGMAHTVVATSGSTGAPRHVVLTPGNVAASVAASAAHLGSLPDDAWLLALPLHHVAGLAILWRAAAAAAPVVVVPRFEPAGLRAAMTSWPVRLLSLVPTMLHRILDEGTRPIGSPLRGVLVGGAATADALLERAWGAGIPALATYGMTETVGQVATVRPHEIPEALGAVGSPLPGIGVAIDPATGEILVSGPTVSPGALGERPRRGPLRTGDVGRLDAAGRLIVEGRRDDMVITGGENVHPTRVDRALAAHPLVAEAVTFGVTDPDWGMRLEAAVVPSGPPPDPAELRAWARERLAPHEVPKAIHVVPDVPRLGPGKPDRRTLAARFAAG